MMLVDVLVPDTRVLIDKLHAPTYYMLQRVDNPGKVREFQKASGKPEKIRESKNGPGKP